MRRFLMVLVIGGCADDGGALGPIPDGKDFTPPSSGCVVDARYTCACTGLVGEKLCLDGSTFGPCVCPDGDVIEAPETTADTSVTTSPDTSPTDTMPTTTATDTSLSEVVGDCEPFDLGPWRFRICGGSTTFENATVRCADMGATLFRSEAVGGLVDVLQHVGREFWTTAALAQDGWMWDGSTINTWCDHQPDGAFLGAPDAKCAIAMTLGCLDDAPCGTVAAGVVCQLP